MKPLIVFSGIDSAGKSTQIDLLRKHYLTNKIRHKVIRSRGGYTSGFETIKNILRFFFRKKLPDPGRNKNRQEMFDKKSVSKIWYMFAMLDLIRLYSITFRFYRFFGFTIIADRYLWDTYVDFKMSLKNINLEKSILWKLAVLVSPKTDKSILLFVSPEVSFQRSIDKKEPQFDSLYVRKLRIEIYQDLANNKKWQLILNTEYVDANTTFKRIEGHLYGI